MGHNFAADERAALADLFLALGPGAPTLCEGWTAYDLAVHLAVREHNPLSGPGIVLPDLFGALTDHIMERFGATHSFERTVRIVRIGPPLHWRPVDRLFNTLEYFVHHEDLRRGADGSTPSREGIDGLEDELWSMTRRSAWLTERHYPDVGAGIELVRPDGDTISLRQRDGEPVRVVGRPGEVTLFLMGRGEAAHVSFEGPEEAIAQLTGTAVHI
jgi:uncharacterized protein (TIGR03085 family)